MTPAQAREIDRQEFEAACKAIRERAFNRLDLAIQQRQPEHSATTRKKAKARTLTHEGKTLPLAEWSQLTGISVPTLNYRLRQGFPVEEVLDPMHRNNPARQGKVPQAGEPLKCGPRATKLTYQGQTHTVAKWAEITGLKPSTIWHRIRKDLPIDEVLNSRINSGPTAAKLYSYNGKSMTLKEWAKQTGVNYHTLRTRMQTGLTLPEAIEFAGRPGRPSAKPNSRKNTHDD
ncbi:MAG: hypothetical protein MnENMB40S_22650 [Rhizobiaceae bacterium MnEN-MB40S]|nr:MAG: hypothetical protein MnENMB40S_22650 [Rhizobiaceae bacterium MnEN-MB40S]